MESKKQKDEFKLVPEIRFCVPPWADPFPRNFYTEVIHRGIPKSHVAIKPHNIKFVFGRAHDCDCVLNEIMVSKYHLMLIYGSVNNNYNKIWAIDLNSQNKTKINKLILEPNRIYPVNHEDVIQLADNEFTLILHYPDNLIVYNNNFNSVNPNLNNNSNDKTNPIVCDNRIKNDRNNSGMTMNEDFRERSDNVSDNNSREFSDNPITYNFRNLSVNTSNVNDNSRISSDISGNGTTRNISEIATNNNVRLTLDNPINNINNRNSSVNSLNNNSRNASDITGNGNIRNVSEITIDNDRDDSDNVAEICSRYFSENTININSREFSVNKHNNSRIVSDNPINDDFRNISKTTPHNDNVRQTSDNPISKNKDANRKFSDNLGLNTQDIPSSSDFNTHAQKDKKPKARELVTSFFDRCGLDPNFQIEPDDNNYKFHAFIELPVYDEEGNEITAHAYSNDKTTIIDELCEICVKIISAHDNLFEAETFNAKKKRLLAENDYYEDDDDVYFDRSGQIESKRDDRLNRLKVNEKNTEVQTYKSMNVKLDLIRKDILDINEKIKSIRTSSINEDDDDELDKYMNSIQNQIDENVRNRYENELKKLKEEEKNILDIIPKLAPIKIMQTEVDKPIHKKKEIETKIAPKPKDVVQCRSESKRKAIVKTKISPKKIKNTEKSISNYCDDEEDMSWIPPENQSGDGITDLNKKYGY